MFIALITNIGGKLKSRLTSMWAHTFVRVGLIALLVVVVFGFAFDCFGGDSEDEPATTDDAVELVEPEADDDDDSDS